MEALSVSKFNGCVMGVTLVRTLLPPIRNRGIATRLNTMSSWSQANALFQSAEEVVFTVHFRGQDSKMTKQAPELSYGDIRSPH